VRSLDICLVTTFYPPWSFGGDAVAVQSLAHALVDDGHRVTVVHCLDAYRTLARGLPPGEPSQRDGLRVVSLAGRPPQLSPMLTYLTGRPALKQGRLDRLFAEGHFDVTHFHNISLFGPGVLREGTGVRLLTLHEHWLVCPMHVLWKDNRELCLEPSCLRCTLRFHRPPQPWRRSDLLVRSLAGVDGVLAPTQFVIDEHERRGLRLERAVVHPYFAPDPGLAPGPRAEARFAYIGRLEPIKGVVPLLEAIRGAPELELVVAGDGAQRDEVNRLAAGLPNVTVVGRLDRDGVAALLSSVTALVIPSVGYEVGPVVAIEAFSHGTPVVGRRLGGIEEHLGAAGCPTFSTDDEIVPALRGLATSPAVASATGARARAQFELRHTSRRHLDAYYELIERSRATAPHAPRGAR